MKIKYIRKSKRIEIYNKYNGHCAYCGRAIEVKDMQVDHQHPLSRAIQQNTGITNHNDFKNLFPSCRSCNHYKRSCTLEEYRNVIKSLMKRCTSIYIVNVALLYGILQENKWSGKFYFEVKDEI